MIKLGYSKNTLKKTPIQKGQDIWFPFQNGMVSYMLIPPWFLQGLIDPTLWRDLQLFRALPQTDASAIAEKLPNMAVAFRLRSRPAISEWTVDQAQLGCL